MVATSPWAFLPILTSLSCQQKPSLYQSATENPQGHNSVFHIATGLGQGIKFSELNELGTTPAPACTKCIGCPDCTFRRQRLSSEDQSAVARVEAAMRIDSITGTIHGEYSWKPCVDRMTNNARQDMKVQESIEKHMDHAGTLDDFIVEMDKAIDKGKVRELTDSEMSIWHGPVHYVTVFPIIKPDSMSTKTRIVSNSAMHNANSRLSLNWLHVGRTQCSRRVADLSSVLAWGSSGHHDGPSKGI